MNVFDYFFNHSKEMNKKFILNDVEDISFKELYRRSSSLAHYLSIKLGENNMIILVSTNSLFFVTCYFAIIKSGNVCVPLNPTIEQNNFNYIQDITDCKLSFISKKVSPTLLVKGEIVNEEKYIQLMQDVDKDKVKNDFYSENVFDENRLAEILFTSGSTGIPKGVMLTHLNLRTNTESILSYLKLTSDDSILLVLPLFYCYGLSVLHTHLRIGASVVLHNNFILLGSVIENLKRYKCTGFAGVPSHFQMLLRKSQTFKNTVFPHLRYVTQAGGKLHDAFIKEFIVTFPEIKFFVMYGQTEATARLTYLDPSLLKAKIGSIGKPIPGVTLRIIDVNDKLIEVGEIGEIIAKGDNIMRGYFHDPTGTKETLKNGWLYTGDLGEMDADGFIFLTARKKAIIKVGGHRVSPKEIEEVIVTLPEVIDCTVVSVDDELLGEAIMAKVVVRKACNQKKLHSEILMLCKQKLSPIKIPQLIDFTLKMGVNLSGKKVPV